MAYNPNNPNGQTTMANSSPVVLASDQSAVPVSDNGGSLTIDGSVSVSGTVTANAGTGTMNVSVQNASIPVTDNGGSLTVDGTIAATQSGTWNINNVSGTISLPTGASTETTLSALNTKVPSNLTVTSTRLLVDGSGVTQPISGTITASNTAGDVAHDSVDSGNPVKIGFQAETSLPTAVAANDRTNGISDIFGRQLVNHIDAGMQVWKSANYTSTQTGTAMWTPASGKKVVVTYLSVASYGTTAARVIIWLGASADTTYTAGTDQLVWAGSFAPSTTAKPGAIISLPYGIASATADYVLRITTDAAISLDVTIYGYEI